MARAGNLVSDCRAGILWLVQHSIINGDSRAKRKVCRCARPYSGDIPSPQGSLWLSTVTLALRNEGFAINHKAVERLMRREGLKSLVRVKKYRSYRGQEGRIAPNILKRDFNNYSTTLVEQRHKKRLEIKIGDF
jgi:hypothetical protein